MGFGACAAAAVCADDELDGGVGRGGWEDMVWLMRDGDIYISSSSSSTCRLGESGGLVLCWLYFGRQNLVNM